MDIYLSVGVLGSGTILLAFILNQLGIWKRQSFSYDVANTIGAALLLIYAYALSSYPFLILNGVWLAISLKDVAAYLLRNKTRSLH